MDFLNRFFEKEKKVSDDGLVDNNFVEIAARDFKLRLSNYCLIKRFLKAMKGRVKYRRELLMEDYLRVWDDDTIRKVLRDVGWLPLDPIYTDNEEWLDAEMDFSDDAIELAMSRYLQPFNRDWCFGLASDCKDQYEK